MTKVSSKHNVDIVSKDLCQISPSIASKLKPYLSSRISLLLLGDSLEYTVCSDDGIHEYHSNSIP